MNFSTSLIKGRRRSIEHPIAWLQVYKKDDTLKYSRDPYTKLYWIEGHVHSYDLLLTQNHPINPIRIQKFLLSDYIFISHHMVNYWSWCALILLIYFPILIESDLDGK